MRIFTKIFSLLLIVTSLSAFSSGVSKENCQKAASKFYSDRISKGQSDVKSIQILNSQVISQDGVDLFYVFNFKDGGYVIVSSDDAAIPVIGYDNAGSFDVDKMPVNLKSWIDMFKTELIAIKNNNAIADVKSKEDWANLLSDNSFVNKSGNQVNVVTPLLGSIIWNQDSPYNALCPVDATSTSGNGRVYAGCVATAMSMIMYYWRYPKQGTSSHSYSSNYGTLSANYGATTYNWNGMSGSVSNQSGENNAVALLQYHAGISVDMDYGPDGSGAFTDDAAYALKTYFKYSTAISSISKYSYTDSQWNQTLKSSLDLGRPVLYSGRASDGSGGHAFVCDGYDASDYFHFNFGWSGSMNGYFLTTSLNPASGYDFSYGQGAVVNIFPLTSTYPYGCAGATTTITDRFGTIEDGSGEVSNYANNNNCSWLIAPTEAVSSITLSFVRFATEASNDVVTIYNGENASAPVLGTYSGSTLPATVSSTGNKMFITFVTNGSTVANGWLANYTSAIPSFCNTATALTAPSGSFEDGSGTYKYNNSKVCIWNIAPPSAVKVTLNFSSFDVEATNDLVKVYSLNPTVLLGEYSGSTLPPTIVSNTGQMRVMFVTNASVAKNGWIANYTSQTVGITENDMLENLNIYPNPTSENLTVEFSMKEIQDAKIEIYNVAGMLVYSDIISNCSGEVRRFINTQNLTKGIYQIRISGSDIINSRFIKN